jgi:hypothetical protein
MMRFKLCFHISSVTPEGKRESMGKLHYRGNTIAEAVEKVMYCINPDGVPRPHTGNWRDRVCTSFTVQRDLGGKLRGMNFKWDKYIKTNEGKALLTKQLPIHEERLRTHAERFGWEWIDA